MTRTEVGGDEGEVHPLTLERADVGARSLTSLIRVASPRWTSTQGVPGLADSVLALFPGIARHRCESGSAHGIAAELASTESAHLVEHVALELMALAGSPRSLGGRTTWSGAAESASTFTVTVEFDDDLVALAALARATEIANALLTCSAQPDVAAHAEALRALRER